MLRCLSRLLGQTKSALRAGIVIVVEHATLIEIHAVATQLLALIAVRIYLINNDVVTGVY